MFNFATTRPDVHTVVLVFVVCAGIMRLINPFTMCLSKDCLVVVPERGNWNAGLLVNLIQPDSAREVLDR